MANQKNQRRRCYVRENDGKVTRRPPVVARGMIARHEAEAYLTGVTRDEAIAILKNGQKFEAVMAARPENQHQQPQGQRDKR